MYPQSHLLFSFLIGLIFFKFGVIDFRGALFVGLIGILVDVDHYLNFIFRKNDFSFKDAWNAVVVSHFRGRTFIHHEIGFVLVTLVLGGLFFINNFLFWIFSLGYYSHLLLDFGHFNILKIKGKMEVKESGFVMRINKFEVMFDIFLVIGIILLIL
jgi:hypothetical protein